MLNNDAGEVNDYPIEFGTFNQQGSGVVKLIAPPRKSKEGHISYFFSLIGFLFKIHIGLKMKLDDKILNHTITPSNMVNFKHISMDEGKRISNQLSSFS